MKSLTVSLQLALTVLARRSDVAFAIGVAMIAALLVVPLPTVLLDILIAVNIGFATLLLIVALMSHRALDISTFPALLLVTTLFRLGLNVSTTRGILADANAGEVVKAFGGFVLRGDVVVGSVIFLVITIVQFLVIAKGAERVAEVAARFTLDAMPGKQMSIDASLRAGAYSEEEAQQKRDELNRQCQLFGNMDGAMKFVKGDAIAGLIITVLNLVAGFIIGVARYDMPLEGALQTYSVLTVGDGLVSQIGALLVSISAGILVTRVESPDDRSNLGQDFKSEVLSRPKVLMVAAGLMMVLGAVPGLPFIPFVTMGLILSAFVLLPALSSEPEAATDTDSQQQALAPANRPKPDGASDGDDPAPWVSPVILEVGGGLSRKLGFRRDDTEGGELLDILIPQMRQALFLETGVQFPGVRLRTFSTIAPRTGFVIIIKNVPVFEQEINADKLMALTPPDRLQRLGVTAEETQHPMGGEPVALIDPADQRVVESSGAQVWNPAGVIALHLSCVLRDEAPSFLGIQEVSKMLKRLEKAYPDLVSEVVPKVLGVAKLAEVLRRLVDEGICIRDLKTIIEVVAEHGPYESDPAALSELVRGGLAKQIAHRHAGMSNRLPVVLLDSLIEDTIESGIQQTVRGSILCIEPELARSIVVSVAHALDPVVRRGTPPVILTSSRLRRLVRKIIEVDLPDVPVLSFEELPSKLLVQPIGRAVMTDT